MNMTCKVAKKNFSINVNSIARLTMPPSLCPFVYIAVVCDLRNGTNMAVYLALLLVHNHVNGITSNSDSNNKYLYI